MTLLRARFLILLELDDKFVVAVLEEINKEGVMSAGRARPMVEFIIRNQKKAGVIAKKIGSANTLEAVASATHHRYCSQIV